MDKIVYNHISSKLNDPIDQRKKCKRCKEEYAVFEGDKTLLDKISPSVGGKKFKLPIPDLCSACRQRKRLMFCNERKIYKSNCDKCGKGMISVFAPEHEGQVYCGVCRWGDTWDAKEYGREYNESKSFFENFEELQNKVPRSSMIVFNNENSDFVNRCSGVKDCYLITNSTNCRECYYGRGMFYCEDCIDCLKIYECKRCYQLINSKNCYDIIYGENCKDCSESYLLFDCQNCNNCFGSANLVNKQYCIFNQQLEKEEYISQLAKMLPLSNDNLAKYIDYIENKMDGYYKRALYTINAQDSVGSFLTDVKNIVVGSEIQESQDCRYVNETEKSNNLMDIDFFGVNVSQSYECCVLGLNANKIAFSSHCFGDVNNIYYSDFCINGSNNLLASVGLKSSENCILNKEYSKEKFEEKVRKIFKKLSDDGEFGELFDPEFSPFPYNDTMAMDYYPVEEKASDELKVQSLKSNGVVTVLEPNKFISDAILDLGGEEKIKIKWRTGEKEVDLPEEFKVIKAHELPDIGELQVASSKLQDILKKAIICEVSGRPFRLIKAELDYYIKEQLPLPTKHPDVRHTERVKKRPDKNLYLRKCDNCSKETLSVYPQDYKFKVFCEECYAREVY